MKKLVTCGILAFVLAACEDAPTNNVSTIEPLGDFKLGHAIVVAKNVERGPLSREASIEELEAALKAEMHRVFDVYQGEKYYNVAVSVDAYILAKPGIPLVASPKSALVVSLNIWDDAKGERITEEHKQFTILEKITGGSLIFGSGLTRSREEQLAGLVKSAIAEIHQWMRENKQVFDPATTVVSEG